MPKSVVEKTEEKIVETDTPKIDVYKVIKDTTMIVEIKGKPHNCFFGRNEIVKFVHGADVDNDNMEFLKTEDAPEKKKDAFYDPTM